MGRETAPLSRLFDEAFPHYLHYGMSPEQFWDQDVSLAAFYRRKNELDVEADNRLAHLQGLYVYEALCAVSPILHAFAKSGTKPEPYPEKPVKLVYEGEEEHTKKSASEEKDKQTRKAMAVFHAMATKWNEALAKTKGASDAGSRSSKTENNVGQPAGGERDQAAVVSLDGTQGELQGEHEQSRDGVEAPV